MLWKYTYWRHQHSVPWPPNKSRSKHPQGEYLFKLYSQFEGVQEINFSPSKTVSISTTSSACPSPTGFNRTDDVDCTEVKDPLQPTYFGSSFKPCIISRSQPFPTVRTKHPNNRIKNCRDPTQLLCPHFSNCYLKWLKNLSGMTETPGRLTRSTAPLVPLLHRSHLLHTDIKHLTVLFITNGAYRIHSQTSGSQVHSPSVFHPKEN